MSGIGAASFGPGVNPYAGNVTSTKGSDAARADSSDRSTAADHAEFAQNGSGTSEASQSDDRDADAFFSASGNEKDQGQKPDESSETADDSRPSSNGSGPAAVGLPLDDHRGNLINFDA